MEQNSQDKGRGKGALHLRKMALVAMQLGTKAIYTSAPLSPFFLPKLHCCWWGPLDWRVWIVCARRVSTDDAFTVWDSLVFYLILIRKTQKANWGYTGVIQIPSVTM